MPLAAPDTIADATTSARPRQRPAWILSVTVDAGLSAAAYLGAYWLRFQGDTLATFLPGAWSTMPLVVTGQLASLLATGVYVGRRPGFDWLLRVMAGVVAGTALSSAVIGLTLGFTGVSRSAFVADALLLSIAATAWRGVWVLKTRALSSGSALDVDKELVDRAAEMTTLTAIVVSLYAYRELLKNLVFKDLKLKYRGSVFGFLWSLINPLLMIVVYSVAFTFILRIGGTGFIFRLMLGQLSWTFFAGAAAMSTGAIIENSGLLKSVLFPRAILPIGTVLFNLAQYLLTISVFLPIMMIWYRVPLSWAMLLFPVFLALQVVFTIGVAFILSTATAFFRDVRHLLEVALNILFWTTPILYELRGIPERLQLLILLSPMSPFIVAYQQLFFYQEWPSASVWLAATAHAVGAFVVGSLLFLAFEDRFTEQL